jgi:hypothetical protein
MSLYGPKAWFAWQLPGGPRMVCNMQDLGQDMALGARLLGALEDAGPGFDQPSDGVVQHMAAESVDNRDDPLWDHVPCTKLINVRVEKQWRLSAERAQLWDILAKHYFHAHEAEE